MSYTEEPLVGQQHRILRALVDGPKTAPELVDIIYGDDPNGGPDKPLQTVATQISYIRRKLCLGWAIECLPGKYRLVRR